MEVQLKQKDKKIQKLQRKVDVRLFRFTNKEEVGQNCTTYRWINLHAVRSLFGSRKWMIHTALYKLDGFLMYVTGSYYECSDAYLICLVSSLLLF
jgi:hypothetical protein